MSSLNNIDIGVLCLILLLAGIGAWLGLVRSIFQTASWAAGAAGGWVATWLLAPWVKANLASIPPFGITAICAFAGFIACFLLVRIVGNIIHGFINKSPLSGLNRLGGALIGTAKALILCSVVMFLLELMPVRGSLLETRNNSVSFRIWMQLRGEQAPLKLSLPSVQGKLPAFGKLPKGLTDSLPIR